MWVDDEIEHLKPHIIFLEQKGYKIDGISNGYDAIELIKDQHYDAVLLDEMMPGIDGLETLNRIKDFDSSIKVIMITKSEEESIMDEAIGQRIDDYLIKPISPSQVFMSLKKNLDTEKINREKITENYLQELNNINAELMTSDPEYDEWISIYKRITKYEIELDSVDNPQLSDTLVDLKKESNRLFAKYIQKNFEHWLKDRDDSPLLSNDILKKFVIPEIKGKKQSVLFVFDCLRYDHWLVLSEVLKSDFSIDEKLYYSLLPTSTPYARNAIFSGLFADEFENIIPGLWKNSDENGLNNHEEQFLEQNLKRNGYKENFSYVKCLTHKDYEKLEKDMNSLLQNEFVSIVVNFIDIMTHSRLESKIIQEMIPTNKAYRDIVLNWYDSSPFKRIFNLLKERDITIYITTDHGAIQCQKDVKIQADKETSSNLRYKYGRSLNVDKKFGITIKNPSRFRLPQRDIVTEYIIANNDNFFVYPTEYNRYANHYKNSFQHGGISLEEMIIPFVKLEGKKK